MNKLQTFLESSRLKFLWTIKTELVWVLCAVAAFFLFGPIVRKIDPTAAPLDPGWLHFIFAAVVAGAIMVPVTFIAINLSFTFLDAYFDGPKERQDQSGPAKAVAASLKQDWKNAPGWARILTFFAVFIAIFGGLVTLALAFAK